MPITIDCPQCGRQLRLPEHLAGTRVQCPTCEATFLAPEPSAEPDDDLAEEPRPRRSAADPAGFGRMSAEEARERVSGPATALQVYGWLQVVGGFMILALAALLVFMGANNLQPNPNEGPEMVFAGIMYGVGGLLNFITSTLVLIGARKMARLEGYGLAITAAIIALVPCANVCCLLSMPFGIWALIVLADPGVKAAFR
jgi:hypothetical protein